VKALCLLEIWISLPDKHARLLNRQDIFCKIDTAHPVPLAGADE
jgi:hypothetical protein